MSSKRTIRPSMSSSRSPLTSCIHPGSFSRMCRLMTSRRSCESSMVLSNTLLRTADLLLFASDLNDVVAELCGNRVGYRTDSVSANGIFKGLYHFAFSKPTEITAARLAWAGGVAAGHLLKTGSLFDLLLQTPRKILTLYQYMTCSPFHSPNIPHSWQSRRYRQRGIGSASTYT